MTIGVLLEHCLKTRYYEPVYDGEGRKKGGVRSFKTVESHIKTIAAFFRSVKQGEGKEAEYIGGMKVCEINVASLRAFRKELLKDREIPTANRILSTLRAILNEAMVNDWIVVNPFAKARKGELITTADERERETILTPAEEQRLLEACSIRSRRHLKALVVAALDTGDDELVFGVSTNVKDSWEAARKDADLDHVRFHDLRHTAATRLARQMELVFVGHVLGHSDPKTTRRCVNKTQNWLRRGVEDNAEAIPEMSAQKIFRAADQILRAGRTINAQPEEYRN